MKLLVGASTVEERVFKDHSASVLQLHMMCIDKDWDFEVVFSNDRSAILQAAEQSGADFVLFVDGDVTFNPENVFDLIETEKPIIGGCVPMSVIDFDKLRNILLDGVPADKAIHASSPIEFEPKDGMAEVGYEEPCEVQATSAKFLLVRKEAFRGVTFLGDMVRGDVYLLPKVFAVKFGMNLFHGCMFCGNGMYMHFEEMS